MQVKDPAMASGFFTREALAVNSVYSYQSSTEKTHHLRENFSNTLSLDLMPVWPGLLRRQKNGNLKIEHKEY